MLTPDRIPHRTVITARPLPTSANGVPTLTFYDGYGEASGVVSMAVRRESIVVARWPFAAVRPIKPPAVLK